MFIFNLTSPLNFRLVYPMVFIHPVFSQPIPNPAAISDVSNCKLNLNLLISFSSFSSEWVQYSPNWSPSFYNTQHRSQSCPSINVGLRYSSAHNSALVPQFTPSKNRSPYNSLGGHLRSQSSRLSDPILQHKLLEASFPLTCSHVNSCYSSNELGNFLSHNLCACCSLCLESCMAPFNFSWSVCP